jgi:hypothetical protein
MFKHGFQMRSGTLKRGYVIPLESSTQHYLRIQRYVDRVTFRLAHTDWYGGAANRLLGSTWVGTYLDLHSVYRSGALQYLLMSHNVVPSFNDAGVSELYYVKQNKR